jgi:hypothetical protein
MLSPTTLLCSTKFGGPVALPVATINVPSHCQTYANVMSYDPGTEHTLCPCIND